MEEFDSKLKDVFGDRLLENEPMAKHASFRIGGPARWYLEVESKDELKLAMELSSVHGVRVIIHGGGSNVLYADGAIDALVLVPALREISIEGSRAIAQAGVPSSYLARKAVEAGLSGLEWMATLPGTVGGAVRGNAGCFGGETKDKLAEVEVLRFEGGKWNFTRLESQELKMKYRHSIFKETEGRSWVIVEAVFELEMGDADALKKNLDGLITKRITSQPANVRSAGCTFKNYEIENDDDLTSLRSKLDVPEAMAQSRIISAGWLVDQLDLKGKQIGGAKISEAHGNFLINDGSATADDVIQLISLVKTRARDEFGIQLEEEIEYVV